MKKKYGNFVYYKQVDLTVNDKYGPCTLDSYISEADKLFLGVSEERELVIISSTCNFDGLNVYFHLEKENEKDFDDQIVELVSKLDSNLFKEKPATKEGMREWAGLKNKGENMEAKEEIKEMVNHPEHYLTEGRVECIELLEGLTRGYEGISAFDIGQFKYLYRMGSKEEKGLSIFEKAAQDVDKIIWYMKDLVSRGKFIKYENKDYNRLEVQFIAEEFAFNKPEEIKEIVKKCVYLAYCLENINEADGLIRRLECIRDWYLSKANI